MATRTLVFAEAEGGAVRVEYDVNDANWRISKARCINNSTSPVWIGVRDAGTLVFQQTIPAGQTQSWNTSGLQLSWQPDYWDTVLLQWMPDGVDLGTYTFEMRVG